MSACEAGAASRVPSAAHASSAMTYVALGDSYASGQGNPGPTAHQWVDNFGVPWSVDDGCHRSSVAYPMLVNTFLRSDKIIPSLSFNFLACSGATTGDLWNSGLPKRTRERLQLGWVTALANARIVTVTVGGDDLNFANVFANCIVLGPHTLHQCNSHSNDGWIADLHKNIVNLQAKLVATYEQIQSAAPNAQLYVVGYPDILPPHPSTIQQHVTCPLKTLLPTDGVGYLASNEQVLNTVVANAAAAVGAHYVNLNGASATSFIGHSVCAANPWINGIKITLNSHVLDTSYSFHPNRAGQRAVANLVEQAIQKSSIAPTWSWSNDDAGNGLLAVSCPSANFCAAIDTGGSAITFNGTSWSQPQYIDTTGGYLNAISCAADATTTFCAAVDYRGNVMTYNGTGWSAPTPIDTGSTGGLARVSCATVTFCVTVDSSGSVLTYNGTSWSAPVSVDTTGGTLYAISCPTITFCVALDLHGNVVTYNGTIWGAPINVEPNGGLVGGTVSCASTTYCMVSDSLGDVITLNGTTWGEPVNIDATRVTSVSCSSVGICTATDYSGNVLTFANGHWSLPTPITPTDLLWAISCPTTHFCAAIGNAGAYTLRQ